MVGPLSVHRRQEGRGRQGGHRVGSPRIPLETKFANDFDSKGAENDLPARLNADLRGNDLEKKINERGRREEPIKRLLKAIHPPGERQSASSQLAVFPV
jgi:hypothetical protein